MDPIVFRQIEEKKKKSFLIPSVSHDIPPEARLVKEF